MHGVFDACTASALDLYPVRVYGGDSAVSRSPRLSLRQQVLRDRDLRRRFGLPVLLPEWVLGYQGLLLRNQRANGERVAKLSVFEWDVRLRSQLQRVL